MIKILFPCQFTPEKHPPKRHSFDVSIFANDFPYPVLILGGRWLRLPYYLENNFMHMVYLNREKCQKLYFAINLPLLMKMNFFFVSYYI